MNKHDMSITTTLPNLGINGNEIPQTDFSKIKDNEEAFSMLMNAMKASSEALEKARIKITEQEKEIHILDKKNLERKDSVIILSLAQIITSLGASGLFTNNPTPFFFVLAAGVSMTILSLFLNFKKPH